MDNYKNVIKTRSARIKILHMLNFIPDKTMVKLQYKMKTKRKLNLKNPQRFTEKLQWYKLYYRDPVMKQCVDKYDVRQYIEKIGLGHLLNECYGVYEKVEDIDFDALPDKFVIKDTIGGGGNEVIICTDKSQFNIEAAKEQMSAWLARNKNLRLKHPGREWVYDGIPHRIIIEKHLEASTEQGLIDYKFFCFNGVCKYLYVIYNRKVGNIAELGVYDTEFNNLHISSDDEKIATTTLDKPSNFDELLSCAKNISKGFPHCRVDMYNENGKIIFGEITFFDGSGYYTFNPDSFDYELGSDFVLPEKSKI